MRISTKGRYTLRMMIDLAEHYSDDLISLRDIAERQEISKKYLEQIIPLLNRAGFLYATRGALGGYRLSRLPSQYTVCEILEITEGDLTPVWCVADGGASCKRSADCPTLPLWQGLDKVVRDYLNGFSLQDLVDIQRQHRGDDYSI